MDNRPDSRAPSGGDRDDKSPPSPPPALPRHLKEDPWEARERMYARYRQKTERRSSSGGGSERERERSSRSGGSGGGGSRSSRQSDVVEFGPAASEERGWENNLSVIGLLLSVGLLMLAEVPTLDGTLRKVAAQAGTALILVLLALTRRWRPLPGDAARPLALLTRPLHLLLLGLLGWTVWEFFRAPYRDFAAVELLRVLAGAAAYVAAAYTLRTPRQAAYVVSGLLAVGTAISLWDIGHVGQTGGANQILDFGYSLFGTHEDIASLLVLLLPLSLSLALSPGIEEKRRLAAIGASIVLGAALLVARTRTSWLGGLVALAVLALLSLLTASRRNRDERGGTLAQTLFSPTALLAFGMIAFVLAGGVVPLVRTRNVSLSSLAHDGSFQWRLESWRGASRMAVARPVEGWGLGSFPVIQGLWTHQGAEVQTALNDRYGHESIAHDYYVQWAADNGFVGLALYVTTVFTVLLTLVGACRRVRAPFGRALLLGCASAVAGGIVDALGSPAYNFFGVSTVFWVFVGLGVAAMGFPQGNEEPEYAPLWPLPVALLPAAAACLGIYAVGRHMLHEGRQVPRGTLSVTITPVGPIHGGDILRWTAHFRDENGKERSTMPGTIWDLSGSPVVAHLRVQLRGEEFGGVIYQNLSTLSTVAPGATGVPIIAHARYCDRYGRWYDAWSMVRVAK